MSRRSRPRSNPKGHRRSLRINCLSRYSRDRWCQSYSGGLRKADLFSPAVVAILAGTLSLPVEAQVRGSERALVTQTVDGTTISVDYGRPHARGREPIFGEIGVVSWGHIWTPGANWATTFEFSKDVELNGHAVPKGEYSVWMIPQPDLWEVILDPNDSIFHLMRPTLTDEQITISVEPVEATFAEALTFSFPVVRMDGTDLVFQWGAIQVPMQITVQSTQRLTIEPEAAEPYPGVYDVRKVVADSPLGPPSERTRAQSRMELTYSEGRLTALWDIGGNAVSENGLVPVLMAPVSGHVFHPSWMRNGEPYETELDLWVEFIVEDGSATGFQIRFGITDVLVWEGTRIN